jgi:hypothetical protein
MIIAVGGSALCLSDTDAPEFICLLVGDVFNCTSTGRMFLVISDEIARKGVAKLPELLGRK